MSFSDVESRRQFRNLYFHGGANESSTAVDVTNEFLRNTSIHGMKYLGQSHRHIFERTCWLVFVLVGLIGSVYCCYLEWCKWKDSPLLVSMDPTIASHEPLIFPAVSLCSTHRVSSKKLQLVLQNPKYSWMNATFLLKIMRYFIKYDYAFNNQDEIRKINDILVDHKIDTNDLIAIVNQVSFSCDDFFVDCQWKLKTAVCSKMVVPTWTDDGLCCSISLTRYQTNEPRSYSSETVQEYGIHTALRVILDAQMFDDSLVVKSFDGFKVLVHNKNDFPDVAKRGFVVASGYDHYVALNGVSISYTQAIPSVPFERRQCYVDGEGVLKYHNKTYTRSGCLFECYISRVLQQCGCLPYYLGMNATKNSSFPNCPLESYSCVSSVFVGRATIMTGSTECMCHATCKDQWFTSEISVVRLSKSGIKSTQFFRSVLQKRGIFNSSYVESLVGLRIFFRYNSGDNYKMDAPYGTKELIAAIGGLLGLGLGFSVISAVELIYFLCIRCCFRKNSWVVPYTRDKKTININSDMIDNSLRITMPTYGRKEPYANAAKKKNKTLAWIHPVLPGEFPRR